MQLRVGENAALFDETVRRRVRRVKFVQHRRELGLQFTDQTIRRIDLPHAARALWNFERHVTLRVRRFVERVGELADRDAKIARDIISRVDRLTVREPQTFRIFK